MVHDGFHRQHRAMDGITCHGRPREASSSYRPIPVEPGQLELRFSRYSQSITAYTTVTTLRAPKKDPSPDPAEGSPTRAARSFAGETDVITGIFQLVSGRRWGTSEGGKREGGPGSTFLVQLLLRLPNIPLGSVSQLPTYSRTFSSPPLTEHRHRGILVVSAGGLRLRPPLSTAEATAAHDRPTPLLAPGLGIDSCPSFLSGPRPPSVLVRYPPLD